MQTCRVVIISFWHKSYGYGHSKARAQLASVRRRPKGSRELAHICRFLFLVGAISQSFACFLYYSSRQRQPSAKHYKLRFAGLDSLRSYLKRIGPGMFQDVFLPKDSI